MLLLCEASHTEGFFLILVGYTTLLKSVNVKFWAMGRKCCPITTTIVSKICHSSFVNGSDSLHHALLNTTSSGQYVLDSLSFYGLWRRADPYSLGKRIPMTLTHAFIAAFGAGLLKTQVCVSPIAPVILSNVGISALVLDINRVEVQSPWTQSW